MPPGAELCIESGRTELRRLLISTREGREAVKAVRAVKAVQAVQAVQPRINDVVYSSNLTHSQAWHGPRPPHSNTHSIPINPH